MPLTVATATSAALEVRRGRPRNICHDIVGWTCANVNKTQNSFAEATQTSRVVSAATRATPVSRKNSFPLHGGRRDIAPTRPREESARFRNKQHPATEQPAALGSVAAGRHHRCSSVILRCPAVALRGPLA